MRQAERSSATPSGCCAWLRRSQGSSPLMLPRAAGAARGVCPVALDDIVDGLTMPRPPAGAPAWDGYGPW